MQSPAALRMPRVCAPVETPRPLPTPADGSALAARLTGLLHRQELFLRGADWSHCFSAEGLERAHTAWFGVGVTTSAGLSRGLPIDVLGMLYGQELVRRALGWERSLVVVADSNAQAAGADALAVRRLAVLVERQLRDVAACLGFPVDVRLTSTLGRPHALPGFSRLSGLPPYVAHQLAQTEHLRQQGAGLKLGWAWPGALQDERYFDDLHARELGTRVGSVYVSGGTTLDPRRPRACPYVCSEPTTRLLLHPEEQLERKLGRAPAVARQRYERLLGKLVRVHCHLTGAARPRRSTALLQDLLEAMPWSG
jgi:hypothetical protein